MTDGDLCLGLGPWGGVFGLASPLLLALVSTGLTSPLLLALVCFGFLSWC